MKIMVRVLVLGLGVLLALAAVHGCSWLAPPPAPAISAVASPAAGHPPFVTTVTAAGQEGGTWTLLVNGLQYDTRSGDEAAVFSDVAVSSWPWRMRVEWVGDDGSTAAADVPLTLENHRPVAHDLWASESNFVADDLVQLDLRYRYIGCTSSSGLPEGYTGIEDPDYTADGYSAENDGYLYNVRIEDVASGTWESVFYGPQRELLGRSFVPGPIFYWVVGYSGAMSPVPYSPWSPESVDAMACCPVPVDPGLQSPSGSVLKRVLVTVREWGTDYAWAYDIASADKQCGAP